MTVPRLLPLIALAPILLPGQQQARPNFFGLPPAPNPASVERGEMLFVSNCGFCHGSTGKGGNNGPDLVRSVLVLHDEGSGVNIGPVILEGRTARGMPKFNMSGAEVADISAYLMSRSQTTVLRSEYSVARSHHSGSGSQKRHPLFWEAAPPQRGPKGFRQAADSDSEGA